MTTLRPEVLGKYMNETFIETGTFDGEGCEVAVKCGFKRVVSFEICQAKFMDATKRLVHYPQVELILGDTYELFPDFVRSLPLKPCTFWLDAHNPEGGVVHKHRDKWSRVPILFELEAIASHPVKTHTILIDDLNHFRAGVFDNIKEQDLRNALLRINPDYRFVYEAGAQTETVLVAV